jgi:hypothetical protein
MSVSKDLALSFAELHREISKCVTKASRLSCLPEVPAHVLVHGTKTRLLEKYFSIHRTTNVHIVCPRYGAKISGPSSLSNFPSLGSFTYRTVTNK